MHCSSFSQSLLQTLKFRDTQDKREKGTKVEHAFLNLSIFHGHVAPARRTGVYRRRRTCPAQWVRHLLWSRLLFFDSYRNYWRILTGKKYFTGVYRHHLGPEKLDQQPLLFNQTGNFVCCKNYLIFEYHQLLIFIWSCFWTLIAKVHYCHRNCLRILTCVILTVKTRRLCNSFKILLEFWQYKSKK